MKQTFTHYAHVDLSTLLLEFSTSLNGLDTKTAHTHLAKYGPNTFDLSRKRPAVVEWLASFMSPLPILLLILCAVSWMVGETKGALVIGSMVFLSITLAFIQEHRSTRAAEKLKELVSIKITVMRHGELIDIPMREVVPGDLVNLSAGDIIPGDLRLIETKDLFVDQSSLTGEAIPAEKQAHATQHAGTGYDTPNICFMGSHVTSGLGKGLVFATAIDTHFGHLAKDITSRRKKTGFDLGVEKFIWLMIQFMLVLVPLVFLINGLIKGDWLEALLFAMAVAVGLTPEMLPLLVTINLAKGAISMAKKKVIVKRLNSIQNLGAMDILCTDKTGTLTQNRIVLEKHLDTNGHTDERVLRYAYLNSHFQSGLKNLMDEAVIHHVQHHDDSFDTSSFKKIDEIPFDFQRRRMSVVFEESDGQHLLICKGAFEELIHQSTSLLVNGNAEPLSPERISQQQSLVHELNQDGFRVLAVGIKRISNQASYAVGDEQSLCLAGYIAFLDPPKDSAKPAISVLNQSGIAVKVLTGDNEVVTKKICAEVGLQTHGILLGSDIDAMSDEVLTIKAIECDVFAKLTPEQKARVIQCLQRSGHVVGYMGDGINDGSALKAADVGISVDTAVDVAKDTADIILLEKNLLVTHDGVIEGRKVFGNIMKYIRMSASSNFGNMFSMLGASALLPFLPMAPVQIMLNNFLYDCSQTSVPTDHVDDEYLKEPRVWDIGSIAKFMIFFGPISSLFDYATFGLMWFIIDARNLEQMSLFQTGWFVESLLSQTLIVYIIRTNKIPFIESKPSPLLVATSTLICLVGIALPYTSIGATLDMSPLPSPYWIGLTVILSSYLALTFFIKRWLLNRHLIY